MHVLGITADKLHQCIKEINWATSNTAYVANSLNSLTGVTNLPVIPFCDTVNVVSRAVYRGARQESQGMPYART